MRQSKIGLGVLFSIVLILSFQNCSEKQVSGTFGEDPGILTDDIDTDGMVFMGDMLVDEDTHDQLLGHTLGGTDQVSQQAAGRNLGAINRRLWPNAIVPVVFHYSASASLQNTFWTAAQRWTAGTGVRFVRRTTEAKYLLVRADQSGCWSQFGARSSSGPTNLNLSYWAGCQTVGITMHEIGHALGMVHEHQRQDRDHFVSIHWSNISSSRYGDFSRYTVGNQISEQYGAYDFRSIMHYTRYNGSTGGVTLSVNPLYGEFNSIVGDAVVDGGTLSWNDKNFIRKLYGFPEGIYQDTIQPFANWTGRPNSSNSTELMDANFSWVSFDNESGLQAQYCRLSRGTDPGVWEACWNAISYQGLVPNSYRMHVRVLDNQFNYRDMVYDFTVTEPIPEPEPTPYPANNQCPYGYSWDEREGACYPERTQSTTCPSGYRYYPEDGICMYIPPDTGGP